MVELKQWRCQWCGKQRTSGTIYRCSAMRGVPNNMPWPVACEPVLDPCDDDRCLMNVGKAHFTIECGVGDDDA